MSLGDWSIDEPVLQQSVKVLRLFPEITFANTGSLRAMELEIGAQLYRRLNGGVPYREIVRREAFPPATHDSFDQSVWESEKGVKRLRQLLEWCTKTKRVLRDNEVTIRAAAHAAGQSFPPQIPEGFDWMAAGRSAVPVWRDEEGLGPNVESTVEKMLTPLQGHIAREGSYRGGVESFYGLKGIPDVGKIAKENLEQVAAFYQTGGSWARESAIAIGVEPAPFLDAVRTLDPFDCPGLRLKMAVEREMLRAEKGPETSDYIDLEHLVFLPYVDVAFVDKRTLHYAKLAVGVGAQDLPRDSVSMLRRSGSMELVLKGIQEDQ